MVHGVWCPPAGNRGCYPSTRWAAGVGSRERTVSRVIAPEDLDAMGLGPADRVDSPVAAEGPPAPATVRSMAALLADPPQAPPRLLEPSLIVEQGLTVLAAPPKVGKTNFWLHVAS